LLTASATASAYVGGPITLISAAADSNDGESLSSSVWTFDDGTSAAGATTPAGTTVTHAYTTAGTHHETITVTEPNGLSASKTFTTVVTPQTVVTNPPVIDALDFIKAHTSVKGRHRHVFPQEIGLHLSEAATLKVVLERSVPGRLKGKTCVAATHARRHLPACTRLVAAGTISRALPGGTTALPLKRKLPPGTYQATITAHVSSGASTVVDFRFHVAKTAAKHRRTRLVGRWQLTP
jgi:PKD repeat protein